MLGAILGGIGLFLLGMTLLTEGMQALAGDALRDLLARYTRTRAAGVATGAITTALVQSSSATTLATIGFVGAGLLTFSQAIGVVYGANLGTTTFAWIVALVGLKVKIDAFALPLIGVGGLVRLFGKGSKAAIGTAVAGFGLIFLGVDILQGGMAGVATRIDPAAWAIDGFPGRVMLVVIGGVMTVIMQSSAAAITTTLTAVHAGTISFEQAAALVIGQNVGTTVTAAIGAMGGTVAARRTALAHILFNVGTGVAALLLLTPFVAGVSWFSRRLAIDDPALALATFHTAFNILGVALFFPYTDAFAAWIERLVPDRAQPLTRRLVDAGAHVPALLLETARVTVGDIAVAVLAVARSQTSGDPPGPEVELRLQEAGDALRATRLYLTPLRTDPTTHDQWQRHVSLLHCIDHLDRLVEACGQTDRVRAARATEELAPAMEALDTLLGAGLTWLSRPEGEPPVEVSRGSDALDALGRTERPALLERTARGEITPLDAEIRLEALRWVGAAGVHAARSLHHLRLSDVAPTVDPGERVEA